MLDNSSPHRSTKTDTRVGDWAAANNVELAYVPFYGSWLNRIEAQFTGLRYFAPDGTDYNTHREQASPIRRSIIRRNSHGTVPQLRKVLKRAAITKEGEGRLTSAPVVPGSGDGESGDSPDMRPSLK